MSLHTTAGYLEQGLSARLSHDEAKLAEFINSFDAVFPQGAEYHHDRMELRTELSDEQKEVEPRNADSHLTFIGAGLRNCVTYLTRPDAPVYFIDLDGAYKSTCRTRTTAVVAYDEERVALKTQVSIPVSKHPIDSVNLADPRIGLMEQVNELLAQTGLERGRVDVALSSGERHVGLTVNEYETLLMQNDLVDVLKNPLRFAKLKAHHMLDDPRASPLKAVVPGMLPPCFNVGAGNDSWCLADSLALGQTLSAAASPYELHVMEGMPHGFMQMSAREGCRPTIRLMWDFLARNV